MAKTVTINQDKLLMLKERVDDKENLVNQNGHAHIVREASPEVDEYEIGGEEKNGENVMGGNYFHAKELNENKISYVDLSEVGEVVIEDWTYDEEEYQEWLVDNELQNTPENKMNYIEDFNVEFEVDLLDNQTYHTMCCEWVYYDDLVEKFGDNMAKKIESEMIENGSFKFDTSDIYADENYDINNPQELNDIAMKLLPHGEYLKGCRGFILSNGIVVYTEGEHNDVLRIPGINDKWQFIKLGNIRLLPNSIDIGSEPTYEQEEVLRYMLRLYDDEEIYLDIFSENGEIGAHYPSADCNYIMGEINRYYSEGIRPQGGEFYESKESGKKILVSEKQLLTLKENTFENWFGNSILKDENGEPIKMYHGTDAEFDSFSKEFIGKTGAHEGYGFNFTPYESRARSYNSKNVIEAYLKVENPMTTRSYNITSSKLAKIISEIDKGVPYTDTIVAAYEPTRHNENWDERYYRRALPVVVRQLIQYNKENEYGDAGIYADICLCGNGDKVKVIDTFEKLGYDSVIFYDNYGKLNTVVVFEPNQIKRTNNKTFSIDSDLMGENNKSKNIIKESQESKSALDKFTDMITESKNSSRAHRQTREIIAKRFGSDINDPSVIKAEQEFDAKMFGEGKRTDWFIVLEPIAYTWYLQTNNINTVQKYLNYIFLKGTESTPPSAYIANIRKYNDFNELKQFIDQQRKADDEASMKTQAEMEVNLNQNYEVRGPLSFEEANKIGEYSCPDGKICYTQDEYTWDDSSYGNYGNNKCYALLRNDWKDVQPKHDGSEANNGLPSPLNQYNGYDSYGLSMIFVWIGKYGQLSVSNTRWNHNAQYAPGHSVDRALSELDIARLMGAPFEQVFGVKKLDILTDIKEKLNNSSINVNDIFDDIFDIVDNVQGVKLGSKYNYVVYETRSLYGFDYQYRYLLWDKPYEEWFDCVYDFDSRTSLGVVMFGDKSKFIDKNGKFYDIAETTKKLLADGKNDMFNIIDGNGSIYRVSYTYSNFNYIDTNANKLLWDKPYEEWFDWGQSPRTFMKYMLVEIDRKFYYFNVDGNIYDFLETLKKRLKNENPQYIFDWVETTISDIYKVQINGRYNFVNEKTNEVIWDKPYEEWFISARPFSFYEDADDTTEVTIDGVVWYTLDRSGKLYDSNGNLVEESKMSSKDTLIENYELEVDSSEIDLSSFKKRHELAPNIWKPSGKLDSRVRLKLLDIADDFWEYVNITWVKPSGIILTGSICNFNWSKYSDIDLHLIADFKEIDEKTEFVKEYLDAKKNEWNNEHSGLQIMGYKVELYVQDLEDEVESNGVYDLEENDWIKEPDMDEIKSIGLNKFSIKERAAKIMTIIDDMYDALASTDDSHKIEQMGDDAKYLWDKVKKMRQNSLEKDGESGNGNIVYKILRRTGYLDRLFKLSNVVYDKSNSITESVKKVYVNEDKLPLLTESQESKNISKKVYINEDKLSLLKESQALKSVLTESVKRYLKTLNEEVVADGNSEHNPYKKRWDAERKALKDFICNFGKVMTSKENGKTYKVYYDKTLSQLIGYNYCICLQWDAINMKPKSIVYIRALDKFTDRMFQANFDARGRDNMSGTYDDLSYRES